MKIVNNNNIKKTGDVEAIAIRIMANYTFTTYWVEGTKEAVHQLHDATSKFPLTM
jgi:hypothetical protein